MKIDKVKLLGHNGIYHCDRAISKCYDTKPNSDIVKTINRIGRVSQVSKHSSVIEHIVMTFEIEGISRAVLQELVRHRMASYTVKSSRYTLQELKKEAIFNIYSDHDRASKYVVLTGTEKIDEGIVRGLETLRGLVASGVPNDVAKYAMPEAYKTNLVMTVNLRSFQNFYELRTSKHALAEIQELAHKMFDELPKPIQEILKYE